MEGTNRPALNMRNIGASYRNWASRRSSAPLQPANTVVAKCRPDCGEGEIRREMRKQVRHGLRDRVMTSHGLMRFVKFGIRGVKFTDRRDPPQGVTLSEDPLKVGMHGFFVVHW
jgi:hypothetical protein